MVGTGKQSALLADVKFAALNRWHITRWRLESSAAGQLSQASAFLRRRRSFLGWRWAFPGSRVFAFLRCSLLLGSVLFHEENKPSSVLTLSIMGFVKSCSAARSRKQEQRCFFLLSQNSLFSTERRFWWLICCYVQLCPRYRSFSTMCHPPRSTSVFILSNNCSC